MRRTACGRAKRDAVDLLHVAKPLLHREPQVRPDDAKLGMFLTDPLVRRPGHRTAPARPRVLEEATFIPDPGPHILLVAQDDAHRRDSPAAPLGPAPSRLPRKRNALAIQGVGDRLQAPTVRIVLKDAPHEGRFARLYLEAGGRG